jgi:ABC-type transport system involved in cytochrome c biogenesis ATPase subunit
MRLTKIHVTNFRSVEDSTEFDVGQVLALVGKNEAGKTAVLQSLAGLNPHPLTPISYDLERDYPRRFLTEYGTRHKEGQATVVGTKWTLSDAEKNAIREIIGDALLDDPVTLYRRYADTEPQWQLPIDFKKAVGNLIASENLTEEDIKPLSEAKTSDDLRKALEAIAERRQKQQRLLDKLNGFPGKNVSGLVTQMLKGNLPQFMYYSYYDRMVGMLRLDTYNARKQGQAQPPLTPGERVFVDFLEYAGTTIEEITTAKTYEGLNARCEAASNRITDQLLEYWTQNPNLEIEVRVTKAEPNDPPPFNEGIITRARVRNNLHKLTLPFSERSAGFIWFFSFLVKFAQVRKTGENLILLLDEPGLTLHGKAQADLLRYFYEKLAPNHQVVYSTHSPFMVPADDLPSVRIVEDRITQPRPGQWSTEGTKVRDDTMVTDRDTLFPLQGALGYEITQTLFVGKHTLLVEGPGDILYLEAWSSALQRRKQTGLDRKWTICPAGGIDKIQPFVALFSGQKLDIAALSDYAKTDKKKLESLRQNKILEGDRLLTFATILGIDEADIEDVFTPELYAWTVNQAFSLPAAQQLDAKKLLDADPNTTRLVKKAEAYFAVLPPEAPEFNHFTPAEWLFRNPNVLDEDTPIVNDTLTRATKVIAALNKILVVIVRSAGSMG